MCFGNFDCHSRTYHGLERNEVQLPFHHSSHFVLTVLVVLFRECKITSGLAFLRAVYTAVVLVTQYLAFYIDQLNVWELDLKDTNCYDFGNTGVVRSLSDTVAGSHK
jgi:hypothetical protein